jgi:methionyl-tRNA synthetase
MTSPRAQKLLGFFFINFDFFKENLMSKITYITTAIPYVNGRPHVGFALELVQADVIARYNRLIGNTAQLQTGTDENAFKNVLTARQLGITTEELVAKNAKLFHNLAQALNISFNSFVRTTDDAHKRGAALLWKQFHPEDIYKKSYEGLYCSGCEDFYLEKDLVDGCCPDHKTQPVKVEETNYFFRLSAYQERLEQLLSRDTINIIPATRKNEVLSFIRSGLRDFSISRAAERSGGWGISVPDDPSQIIYVWIDALANYISGLGYGTSDSWKQFWNEGSSKIHVIGKNVWKFHAIYWPALLLSAGLPLPNEIVVHGFLTEDGCKISKSCGSTIDPIELVKKFGADAVRYYLLGEIPPFNDGDFSVDRFQKTYDSKLANNLGNLVSRLTSLCEKAFYDGCIGIALPKAPQGYHEAFKNYEFDKALETLWKIVTELNQDIDRQKPWILLKEENNEAVKDLLSKWLGELQKTTYWLAPFLPATSESILAILSQNPIKSSGSLFPKFSD